MAYLWERAYFDISGPGGDGQEELMPADEEKELDVVMAREDLEDGRLLQSTDAHAGPYAACNNDGRFSGNDCTRRNDCTTEESVLSQRRQLPLAMSKSWVFCTFFVQDVNLLLHVQGYGRSQISQSVRPALSAQKI
jgi:hypothetical protein